MIRLTDGSTLCWNSVSIPLHVNTVLGPVYFRPSPVTTSGRGPEAMNTESWAAESVGEDTLWMTTPPFRRSRPAADVADPSHLLGTFQRVQVGGRLIGRRLIEAQRKRILEGRDLPPQHPIDPAVVSVVLGAAAGEQNRQCCQHHERYSQCTRRPRHRNTFSSRPVQPRCAGLYARGSSTANHRFCARWSLSPSASVPSRADANPAPIEADDVAELQLPSASAINLAVHGHIAVDDGLFHVSTGVEEPSELQELPEANDLTTDRDVVDRSRVRHPRMLVDRVPAPTTVHQRIVRERRSADMGAGLALLLLARPALESGSLPGR